ANDANVHLSGDSRGSCAKEMGIRSPRRVRAMHPVLQSGRRASRCHLDDRPLVSVGATTYDEKILLYHEAEGDSMSAEKVKASLLELIRRTSAVLPPDVTNVLEMHRALEQQGSRADLALDLVRANIGLAKRLSAPICQDTGTITFYIKSPI